MSLFQKPRDPSSIITEYKKHMYHYVDESKSLIILISRLLEDFSSSPIIPPEVIESLAQKGHSALSDFDRVNHLFYNTISVVESADLSMTNSKTNRQTDQVKLIRSARECFKEAKYEAISVIKILKSLCEEVYFVDDYWCKQHWLNGHSRFCKSNIDNIIERFEHIEHKFYYDCSCLLEELCIYAEL